MKQVKILVEFTSKPIYEDNWKAKYPTSYERMLKLRKQRLLGDHLIVGRTLDDFTYKTRLIKLAGVKLAAKGE